MPMLSPEERKKGQERGQQYTSVSGQEIANIEQKAQNKQQQQQPRNLGVEYAPPSPPLDLSRGQVPFMAQGFTPAGEPYYGPGVQGYLRGAFARIFNPEPLQESFNQEQRDLIKANSTEITNRALEVFPFLNDYRDYVQASVTATNSVVQDPSKVIGTFGRYVKELGFGGLNALQITEKPFRYTFAGQQALSDIASGTILPKQKRYGDIRDTLLQYTPTTIAQDLYKIAGKRREEGEDFKAFLATVGAALQGTGLGITSQAAGIFLGSQALTETEKKKFQNYQRGSNMVYTTMIDDAKRYEYIRRAQAGENPDFLIEEIQNPWVELAGSLVFDALNFLPTPTKGKRLASAGDEFAKIIDPDIAKAVEQGAKVLTDNDALPLAQRVGSVITEKINQSANKMVSWGNTKDAYKIFNPTASGKQFLVGRRVGTVIEFVAKNASNADEGAEVISMMTRAYKGEQQAIAYLLRSKYAHMVFSQSGVDTMAMLGRLSDELGGAKFLDTVKKATSSDELLKFISPKMEKTIANMLPSLEDMQDAVKAVTKGTATDIQKQLAKQYDQVSPSIKAAEMVNKKLGKFYAPFNRFFASAYMGLSPGYAFRNLISDTTAVFADQGAVSALKNIKGNVQDLFSAGAVTQRRIDNLAKLGIAVPSPALAGKGAHAGALGTEGAKKFLGIFPDMRAVAESFEQGSSVNIFANAVKREMKRAVKNGMLPDLSGLKDLGVSQTAVDELVRLTLVNDGNVGVAMKQWRKMAADGQLLLRKQINMPDNVRGLLSHFGLDSRLDDLLDGTADEFQQGLEEIKNALIEQAEKVAKEEPRVADDAAQELVNFEDALSDISEKLPLDERLFRARRQALNNVISSTEDAFNEALKHLEVNGYPISDIATRGLTEMRSRFDEVARRTRAVTDSVFEKKTGLMAQSKGDKDLATLWRGVRIHGKDLGEIPDNLTGETFRNAVYNLWKDTTKREWAKAGDNYYQTLFDLVRGSGIPDIDQVLTTELWQKAASQVDEMHMWTDVASWDNVVPYWMQQTLERIDNIPNEAVIGQLYNWQLKKYGWNRGKRGLGNLANKVAGNTERTWDEVPAKEALTVLNEWKLAVSRGEGVESAEQTVLKARELLGENFVLFDKAKAQKIMDNAPQYKKFEDAIDVRENSVYRIITKEEYDDFLKTGELRPGRAADTGGMVNFSDKPIPVYGGSAFQEHGIVVEVPRSAFKEGTVYYGGTDVNVASKEFVPSSDVTRIWGIEFGTPGGVKIKELTDLLPNKNISSLRPPPPVLEESPPELPRQLYTQIDTFLDEIGQWSDEVMNVWNETEQVFTNPEIEKVLGEVERVASQRFEQAKAFSTAVGVAERDFALHKYGDRTYMDVVAGFVFPYHYWYTRSVPKWLQRSVENPLLIAEYGKYRRLLEGLHAGMPEWWKYNLSTNDLPGVDMENPLYFNLEATLNPVNGITGVDFNDSTKRATWYARLVDDLGKFGPTTFTPISWMVAGMLYSEGETEAAERWMGRLIPATATLKSVLNLANVDTPLPYNEVDPFVQIFSGGLDPFERKRVGRALSGLVGTNGITEEQAIDAAYRQSGPLWDEAFQVASDDRALGNISSFMFGVGFKGRNESEIAIDSFYDEYFNLKDLYFGNVISNEEYKDQLAYLKDKYPFMDTVLLSRRSGEDRDTAYTFNVLSRIPPGQSEIVNSFGITKEELNQFYNDPYAIDEWDQAKRDKFLGSIYELSTTFQLPNTATRLDWNAARNTYKNLNEQLKEEFGDDILDQMDYYYNEKDKNTSRLFLDAHPELQAAMDRRTELIVMTPNLMQYYGGLDTLDRYLNGKMYDKLERSYGSDITQRSQEYSDAKYRLFDSNLASQILKENPNLKGYWKAKSKYQDEITRALALYGTKIETVMPQVRPDYVGNYQQPTPTSYQEWQNILGDPMMQALDNYVRGGDLPKSVESELDYLAGKYGYENGYDLAVDALSAQIDNSGIPDAYIARAILDNTSTLQELVSLGGELPPEAQQEIQWLASVYGVSPDFVYSVVSGK